MKPAARSGGSWPPITVIPATPDRSVSTQSSLVSYTSGLAAVKPALILAMRLAGRDYSQVLLPTLLSLLFLGLAAHYRTGIAYAEKKQRQLEPTHEYANYDIFISYRRTHAEWVQQHLLPLLRNISHPDGRPLRIFWDNRELHSGNYNRQLEMAIHESRIFLPLLTPEYFDPKKK